jgi:hypothetical protein
MNTVGHAPTQRRSRYPPRRDRNGLAETVMVLYFPKTTDRDSSTLLDCPLPSEYEEFWRLRPNFLAFRQAIV